MTDYITRLATLVDKETKQILEDSLDLIKQIKYMVGIAERGTGKKCPDGERPEAFLLAYVKSLEAALAQQDAQAVPQGYKLVPVSVLEAASESLGNFVSDLGWADADMQAMDNLDAILAAPTPPAEQDAQAPGSDIPGAVRRPLE